MRWWAKMKKAHELKKYDIDATLQRIQEARAKCTPGTPEFARLQEAYELELKNKKLVKEMKYLGFPKDKILLVVGMLVIAGFGFALDLDSPKALKSAQFVLSLAKKA
jgi:hypothetical protein